MSTVVQRSSTYLAEAADRSMIRDVLARYAWELDHGSPERWADLFTEDGRFEVPAMNLAVEGHAALAAFATDLQAKMPGVHHAVIAVVIDLEGDKAQCRCPLNEFMLTEGGITTTVQGYYEDELIFDQDAWRIKLRRVTVQFPDLAAQSGTV